MHRDEHGRLVGARQDVPLVVGRNGEESFIASDVAAILAHTNRIIFLEEGDVADVRPTGVVVTDLLGAVRERTETRIDWSPEVAEKGGYEHFMLKEIHEQPLALRQSLAGRVGRDDRIHLPEIEAMLPALREITRIELVACGTASYAALGDAAGELKPGPISLLDAECPLVAVATRSSTYDKLISNVMEGRARDARVIAVATEGDPQIERFAEDVCWVPGNPESI